MRNIILLVILFVLNSCVKYGCGEMCKKNPNFFFSLSEDESVFGDIHSECEDELKVNLGIRITYFKASTFEDAEVWTVPNGYEGNFKCVKDRYRKLSMTGRTFSRAISLFGGHDASCLYTNYKRTKNCSKFREDLKRFGHIKFTSQTKKALLGAKKQIGDSLRKCRKRFNDKFLIEGVRLLVSKDGKVIHFYNIRDRNPKCVGVIGEGVTFPKSDSSYIQEFSYR